MAGHRSPLSQIDLNIDSNLNIDTDKENRNPLNKIFQYLSPEQKKTVRKNTQSTSSQSSKLVATQDVNIKDKEKNNLVIMKKLLESLNFYDQSNKYEKNILLTESKLIEKLHNAGIYMEQILEYIEYNKTNLVKNLTNNLKFFMAFLNSSPDSNIRDNFPDPFFSRFLIPIIMLNKKPMGPILDKIKESFFYFKKDTVSSSLGFSENQILRILKNIGVNRVKLLKELDEQANSIIALYEENLTALITSIQNSISLKKDYLAGKQQFSSIVLIVNLVIPFNVDLLKMHKLANFPMNASDPMDVDLGIVQDSFTEDRTGDEIKREKLIKLYRNLGSFMSSCTDPGPFPPYGDDAFLFLIVRDQNSFLLFQVYENSSVGQGQLDTQKALFITRHNDLKAPTDANVNDNEASNTNVNKNVPSMYALVWTEYFYPRKNQPALSLPRDHDKLMAMIDNFVVEYQELFDMTHHLTPEPNF